MSGIVIDIDGVVADSEKWLVRHIEESTGKKLTFTNPQSFQFNIDIPAKYLIELINDAIVKYKFVIAPINYTSTYVALTILKNRDGVVNFLSARGNGEVEVATRWWIEHHFPTLRYNLNNVGEHINKAEWMKFNGFDAIVDDRFKTCNLCDFDNGLTFLVNQPWNVGRREWDHVNRVSNLYEAVQKYCEWIKK